MANNLDNYSKQEIINAITELDYFWGKSFNVAERLNDRLLHNRTQTELAKNSQLVDDESMALRAYLDWVTKSMNKMVVKDYQQGEALFAKWQVAAQNYHDNQKVVDSLIMQGGLANEQ